MKIIDTHQHLWDPEAFRYAWLDDLEKLNLPFGLADYKEATQGLEIEKTIFVECDVAEHQMHDEALHVLQLAEAPGSRIAGVIASARPEHAGFESYVEKLRSYSKVKGVRRILHTQPDELGLDTRFIENVGKLANCELSFDICVLERQLPIAVKLVAECPSVTFILDHCGVPQVKERILEPWREQIRKISRFPNVFCKVSGIVAYADPVSWKPDDLRPFVDHVIECFGWDRVMFGSDWPVCTLAASYTRWVGTLTLLTREGGQNNQAKLFRENAIKVYRLE